MTPSLNQPAKTRNIPLLIILAVAVAAGAGIVWFLNQPVDPAANLPVLTPEATAYTRNLQLGGVEMKATENQLGQKLVEIYGQITNGGDRPLRGVVLQCVFYDPYSQVIARELVPIVRSKEGVLYPTETRRFRLPFDALPESWNQTMPQLVIAEITFEDE